MPTCQTYLSLVEMGFQSAMNNIIAFLGLKKINLSTEEGRSSERHRRILLTTAASLLAKAVMVGTSLVSIPLTLHYLGTERFGLWMTISSVIAMLGFADFGMGNGLLNSITEANGKDDTNSIRCYISSAFLALGVIAVIIVIIFFAVSPFIQWAKFFNVKSVLAANEAPIAVSVFIGCFALNIPAGIVQRVQLGLQLGFIANLWQTAGSLLGLFSVLTVIHFQMGLPWLVGAMVGVPILVAIVNGVYFFIYSNPSIRPGFKFINRSAMNRIAKTGILFMVLQLAVSFAFASDNIIIARTIGSESVTQFAVHEKIFSIIPIILGMLLMPLWPAYGEAVSRGDSKWIIRTFKNSFLFSLFFSLVVAVMLVGFAPFIFSIWIGPNMHAQLALLLGFAVWKVCEATGNSMAILLNGINFIKIQVGLASLLALVTPLLKIYFIGRIGISGCIWATVTAYSTIVLIPYILLFPSIIRQFPANGKK